jgi:hypothetical protein
LGTWQVGFAPRAEIVLPRRKLDILRELISSFPVWVRGAALASVAAAMVLLTLSLSKANISVKNGNFALSFGSPNTVTGQPGSSSDEIEKAVRLAIASEREKMREESRAQMASFKEQLAAEQKAQLQAVIAEHQIRIQAVRASLKSEIARVSRQNQSIRPFFDSDNYADIWATGR